ncbi:hypothetical protein BGZ76_007121 [Entomortierella beljakovae]|nr:hypothetical protein BGZ76_007121 [Entomortierella beljakovae]
MTIQIPSDDSTYVIKYMNLMGRAGVTRVLLHLAGVKYTNEFVSLEDVTANKDKYPFGHVPLLIEKRSDGTTFELGEAIAIEQYLAEKFGLLGSNIQERAQYKSVALNIYLELYTYCFASAIPIQQQIADKESEFNTKALPQFIKSHETWLKKNGNNGHYFGTTLTYPDLVMLNWFRVIESLGVTFEESSPIKKLEQVVKELKEWKGQYDAFHPFKVIEP